MDGMHATENYDLSTVEIVINDTPRANDTLTAWI